jgi:hypothetical protein
MRFDPGDNLFGEPLIAWVLVGLVWAAPFVWINVSVWWAEKKEEADRRLLERSALVAGGDDDAEHREDRQESRLHE